jgi:hypothetical protein
MMMMMMFTPEELWKFTGLGMVTNISVHPR